jgi:hypothetical protein
MWPVALLAVTAAMAAATAARLEGVRTISDCPSAGFAPGLPCSACDRIATVLHDDSVDADCRCDAMG